MRAPTGTEPSTLETSPGLLLAAPEVVVRRGVGPREAVCDFRAAYIFAAGHPPSEALCGPTCSGTVAENTISAGDTPDREAKFALCTRHSDLLWLLGYHGELRDGGSLKGARSPARSEGAGGASVPPPNR